VPSEREDRSSGPATLGKGAMWLPGLSSDEFRALPLPNNFIPRAFLSPILPVLVPSVDFFPVIRSREDRVRSSDDLLEPDGAAPLRERVRGCEPLPKTASAEGRRVNDEGGMLFELVLWGEVGRLILRASRVSSPGRIREMDLFRGPPLIEEDPP
jgi:hypothetical protein